MNFVELLFVSFLLVPSVWLGMYIADHMIKDRIRKVFQRLERADAIKVGNKQVELWTPKDIALIKSCKKAVYDSIPISFSEKELD